MGCPLPLIDAQFTVLLPLTTRLILRPPPPSLPSCLLAGPFTRQLTKTLAIHNPHARPVGFKIKTTAPKQYCVRPNAGRVEPGETVEVAGE